jgi:2-polyprenyl-3-methyl-5-hydroxy-6-metoxy-1,4-benzoquinol methylase
VNEGDEIWNEVYKLDNTLFEEPSNFSSYCFNLMKTNEHIKKILGLGAAHDRDSIFFASNGFEVKAIDYSVVAVEILTKTAKEKRLSIKSMFFDIKKKPLPFQDIYFDVVYSALFI